MKKIAYWIIGVLFLILIVTNPSPNDFRSFLHFPPNFPEVNIGESGRDYNFFIFSIYSGESGVYPDRNRYLGIFGNFFKIGSAKLV